MRKFWNTTRTPTAPVPLLDPHDDWCVYTIHCITTIRVLIYSRTGEVKQICIVGAGPGGLAALKMITETPQYKAGQWKATVLEAREKVGGVW